MQPDRKQPGDERRVDVLCEYLSELYTERLCQVGCNGRPHTLSCGEYKPFLGEYLLRQTGVSRL